MPPPTASIGFGPTRKAISRIAKEGRKYGVFLGLVTQRPAELDSTIISQCSTLFAMRMANERDQAIVRSAVSDAAANLLAFVPSLGTREVLAFGEGVALPTRLKFKQLPASISFRRARRSSTSTTDPHAALTEDFIDTIIDRWRGATMSHKQTGSTAARISNRWRATSSRRFRSRRRRRLASQPQPTHRRRAARRRAAARSGPLQAVEEAARRRQRRVRAAASRAREPAAWQQLTLRLRLETSNNTARGPRASPSPRSACRVKSGHGLRQSSARSAVQVKVARAHQAQQRPFGVVRPVGREAEFAAGAQHARERARCWRH